jgi:hypothetical protein
VTADFETASERLFGAWQRALLPVGSSHLRRQVKLDVRFGPPSSSPAFGGEADINWQVKPADSVANDPTETSL